MPVTGQSRQLFGLKGIHFICWVVFLVAFAPPIVNALASKIQSGRTLQEERDFVFFYSMGRMLNEYPAARLYDFDLQKKVEMDVMPLKNGRQYTPNPYPPFVAVLFRPFAKLPFSTAYPLWLFITLTLYVSGLAVMTRTFFAGDVLRQSLIFCFALSYSPFLWIMTGGQISIIGFTGFVLAFCLEKRGRFFLSGLGLAVCIYKPTLLLLMLPMLLITRRFRTLFGFTVGTSIVAAIATVFNGVDVWSGYARMLFGFGSAAVNSHGYRVLDYYIDLAAFSSLLPGGRSPLGGVVLLAGAGLAAFFLFGAWRQHIRSGRPADSTLVWAATLTWTFILNLYVPIYDTVSLVVAVIATASVFQNLPDERFNRRFRFTWIAISIGAWVTIDVTRSIGIQLLTVLVAVLGTLQLTGCQQIGRAPVTFSKQG